VSSHNVEVVRRIYSSGAWDGEGDPRLALDFIDPEFEFVNPVDAVVPGTRHGHEGFRLAMQSAVGALEHFSHEPIRFTDAGEKVIVDIMLYARGRMSGLSLSRPEWHVWTLRNGKAVRVEWFKQEEAAQRFAGLTDPPNSN
jgi:ketosteroid isomerase-like protein